MSASNGAAANAAQEASNDSPIIRPGAQVRIVSGSSSKRRSKTAEALEKDRQRREKEGNGDEEALALVEAGGSAYP